MSLTPRDPSRERRAWIRVPGVSRSRRATHTCVIRTPPESNDLRESYADDRPQQKADADRDQPRHEFPRERASHAMPELAGREAVSMVGSAPRRLRMRPRGVRVMKIPEQSGEDSGDDA